jgi:AcrR family transcriptional regulator
MERRVRASDNAMARRAAAVIAGEPSLRVRKNLLTRQTIIEEAARLFRSRGYSNTTLRDIADAALTSVATIMRYFDSKDAILLHHDRAIVSEVAERVRARAYETLGEGVRDAMRTSLRNLSQRERLFDVILADPACELLLGAMRREWESVLEALFLQFCPKTKEGRLRAKSLAFMLTASGMANVLFWHEDGKRGELGAMQQDLQAEFIAAFVKPIDENFAARKLKANRG